MLRYILLSFFFVFFSCENETKNSHQNALPHTQVEEQTKANNALTLQEQQKLSNAKGRSVAPLTQAELAEGLQNAGGKLYVFNFWSLDCEECDKNNRYLEKLQAESEDNTFELIHINMDEVSKKEEVNLYIRQNSLTGQVLQLTGPADPYVETTIGSDTDLPALYLINNEEGVNLFYQQAFDFSELSALIQPLVL